MKKVIRAGKKWGKALINKSSKKRIEKINNSGPQPSRYIARSILYSLNKEFLSIEEQKIIEQIEGLRRDMQKSNIMVVMDDFGAGRSYTKKTTDEMQIGESREITLSEVTKASSPSFWAMLLFRIIREIKPINCIELGTCVGISGAYQAAALKLNNKGKLFTLEGASSLAEISKTNFVKLKLSNVQVCSGRFQDNLPEILKKINLVHYAFIDGHHDKKATIAYFYEILPFLSDFSILVFDDISWNKGMSEAWQTIANHSSVKIAFDLRKLGICIFDKSIEEKKVYRIPLYTL